MAFDGITVSAVTSELKNKIIDGRIDKITQPEKDEVWLNIRGNGTNYRLIISASSQSPRIHLSASQKENPIKAPMFCMLLRKYISSGRIVDITQPDFERIIILSIESRDELGYLSVKKLIVEIMGRYSNIILTDSEGKILGSIKHIDFTVSSVRQVIPGMLYEMPPSQGKLNPMIATTDEINERLKKCDTTADKFIMDHFTGIGPMNTREIAYTFFGDVSASLIGIDLMRVDGFAKHIINYFKHIENEEFTPILLYKNEKKIWDFNAMDITQYGGTIRIQRCGTICEALDEFYTTRDNQERMSQKSGDLIKFVETNIARCQKKLALQMQKLKDCENKEQNKIYGDLLMTNMHMLEKNMTSIEVENYYDNMKLVKINLKPELYPPQNVQRYYTLYQKAKNAEIMTGEQITLTKKELEYLDSVLDSILRSDTEKDVNEIRDELYSQGYSSVHRKNIQKKNKKQVASEPMKFIIDGYEVYVGKNNLQNDMLTLKMSKNSDLWFHVKNIPGSHTVLKTTGGEMPNDDVIVKAAKICAFHSKAKTSANVPVDYTIIKNVKKPNGAKPGMVIYDNYNTVNVTPTAPDAL